MKKIPFEQTSMADQPHTSRLPFVDWLSFSLPYSEISLDFIQSQIGRIDWRNRGFEGYPISGLIVGGGMVGLDPNRPENRIHVSLSAKALSVLQFTADDLISQIFAIDGKFSRIDIAKDDYDGLLNITNLEDKFAIDEVRTRFKTSNRMRSRKRGSGIIGDTLYLGSRDSESFCRIYDKQLQTNSEGSWIRVEIEFKGKKAHVIGRAIALGIFNADNLILGYIEFIDSTHQKKQNCLRSPFWDKFLNFGQKERITLPKYERGLEEIADWVQDQTTGALGLIARTKGIEEIQRLILIGLEKAQKSKRYQKIESDFWHWQQMQAKKDAESKIDAGI